MQNTTVLRVDDADVRKTAARRRGRADARPLFVIAAALAVLALPALAASDVLIRCRWPSPNGRTPLDLTFANDPMLIVPPGESLLISCAAGDQAGKVKIIKDGQAVREDSVLNFTAPDKPGAYFILLELIAGERRRDSEICVLVPYKASARKNADGFELRVEGKTIGQYRVPSRSGNVKVRENPDSYQPPAWWLRVTGMNAGFEVVPGVTAGDLVIASEDTGTKHTDLVPVCYPMWNAIVTLRAALESRGIPGRALRLISMYRSPPYNRSIGSNAYGRHIYGDAFDFYIDIEGSEKASDLNRDGKRDRRDAYVVVSIIEELQASGKLPMGGIGVYNSVTGDHEVTMHLDMRGHRATWGFLYSPTGKKSEFSWASRQFADLDRRDEDKAAARAAQEGRKYSRPRREPLE